VLTAARVARPVFDELAGRGVHVTQAFGMSEGLFLFSPLDAPADLRAETVGVPISPLDEVRVLRPGTEVEVADGETGELAARGPYTIRGYLAAPNRDCEAFTAKGLLPFRRPRAGTQVPGDAELLDRGAASRTSSTAAARRSTPKRWSSWSRGTPPLPRSP
jgi:acyl-CoA synthetase (AMP-forming)/AMP-acid ligase II